MVFRFLGACISPLQPQRGRYRINVSMTTSRTHPKHTFVINFFGALGYVMTLLVWLLVINTVATIAFLSQAVNNAANEILALEGGSVVAQAQATSSADVYGALRFLLICILLVASWAFFYFVARSASHVLRHFLVLFGRKITMATISTVKYFVIAAGLIGLVVLLQFIPNDYAATKMVISLFGLMSGVVGVGSIWLQRLLVHRYRVAVSRVL